MRRGLVVLLGGLTLIMELSIKGDLPGTEFAILQGFRRWFVCVSVCVMSFEWLRLFEKLFLLLLLDSKFLLGLFFSLQIFFASLGAVWNTEVWSSGQTHFLK